MDNIEEVYYRYANIQDIYYNDIVMSNSKVHRFFRRMGIRMEPMQIADLVYTLDPYDLGYVTLNSIKKIMKVDVARY